MLLNLRQLGGHGKTLTHEASASLYPVLFAIGGKLFMCLPLPQQKNGPLAEGTVLTHGYTENTAGVSVRFSRDFSFLVFPIKKPLRDRPKVSG
jgi:hypothetical protein